MPPAASDPAQERTRPFSILLVEDNPADQRLLEEELACTDVSATRPLKVCA